MIGQDFRRALAREALRAWAGHELLRLSPALRIGVAHAVGRLEPDALQEASEDLYAALLRGQVPGDAEAYSNVIAQNAARGWAKKQRRLRREQTFAGASLPGEIDEDGTASTISSGLTGSPTSSTGGAVDYVDAIADVPGPWIFSPPWRERDPITNRLGPEYGPSLQTYASQLRTWNLRGFYDPSRARQRVNRPPRPNRKHERESARYREKGQLWRDVKHHIEVARQEAEGSARVITAIPELKKIRRRIAYYSAPSAPVPSGKLIARLWEEIRPFPLTYLERQRIEIAMVVNGDVRGVAEILAEALDALRLRHLAHAQLNLTSGPGPRNRPGVDAVVAYLSSGGWTFDMFMAVQARDPIPELEGITEDSWVVARQSHHRRVQSAKKAGAVN